MKGTMNLPSSVIPVFLFTIPCFFYLQNGHDDGELKENATEEVIMVAVLSQHDFKWVQKNKLFIISRKGERLHEKSIPHFLYSVIIELK